MLAAAKGSVARRRLAPPRQLAAALAAGRRLGQPDPGDPDAVRRRDRRRRHAADPRRLQRRGAQRGADPRQRIQDRIRPRSAPTSRKARGSTTSSSPTTPRPGSSTSTATCSKESTGAANLGPPQAGLSDHGDIKVATEPIIAAGGNSPALRPVRPQRRARRLHRQPPLALHRRRHPLRHPARQLRRGGDRRPGDAPDRLADRDRAGDRRPPATPRGGCRSRRSRTRSASWP